MIGYQRGSRWPSASSRIWLLCRTAITRPFIKSLIDQVCSIMMAGFLPCSLICCLLVMALNCTSVHKHAKEQPIFSHLVFILIWCNVIKFNALQHKTPCNLYKQLFKALMSKFIRTKTPILHSLSPMVCFYSHVLCTLNMTDKLLKFLYVLFKTQSGFHWSGNNSNAVDSYGLFSFTWHYTVLG